MIERLHRQLKAAIMAHSKSDWTEVLPFVLLGIRSAFKEDITASSAELVYGEPLRLPGEFFIVPSHESNEPQGLVSGLRKHMNRLRPTPTSRHIKPGSFVFKNLSTCDFVFLRQDCLRESLQAPYSGPYKVICRDEKTITIIVRGQETKVSLDRVKPAYIFAGENPIPESTKRLVPTGQAEETSKLPPYCQTPSTKSYTTRSGRQIRPRVTFQNDVWIPFLRGGLV
ncbi:uncharacterized protein LOC128996871 [Macrosteles quadrilineatus]|uniref:uncharacterized protein LOC128996871 n=1 Tax=Macrosteles quadrilineatus TaxID=74068 RepID=UPI0023E0F69D|nr:uncharacterized protein LOC128996871 [Macrosteles quadrilineatus]